MPAPQVTDLLHERDILGKANESNSNWTVILISKQTPLGSTWSWFIMWKCVKQDPV